MPLLRQARHYYQRLVDENPNLPTYVESILNNFSLLYIVPACLIVVVLDHNPGYQAHWSKQLFELGSWWGQIHENRVAWGVWFVYHDFVRFHVRPWLFAGVFWGLNSRWLGID